jgi:hypothetical protein
MLVLSCGDSLIFYFYAFNHSKPKQGQTWYIPGVYYIWIVAKLRYRSQSTRYPYIPILYPISGMFLKVPDIGVYPISEYTRYRSILRYQETPISGKPDIGNTPISGSYTDVGTTDIGVFPISELLISHLMLHLISSDIGIIYGCRVSRYRGFADDIGVPDDSFPS